MAGQLTPITRKFLIMQIMQIAAWSLCTAVAAQSPSQFLSDVSSSGGISSSSSPSVVRREPRYSAENYFWMIVGTEICIFTLVALVVQRLPMKLFTRLASQVFGFELSQTLYRRAHPRKLSINHLNDTEQQEKSAEDAQSNSSYQGPDGHSELMDIYLHTRPGALWVMGREVVFNESVLNAEEEDYANKPLTKWCWLHGLNAIRTGSCCRRGCLKARPRSVEYRIRNSIQQMIHWSVYISLALLVFLVVMGNTRYSVNPNDRMCPPEIMQSGAGQWDCFLFASNSGFYVTSYQYINCDERIPDEISLHSTSLACFQLYSPTTENILQSISAVASLFSIVFGGSTALFGWLLANMRTERRVTWMYAIPITITIVYLIMMFLNWLHTSLAIVAPLAAIALSVFMIRVRMAVGFEVRLEQEVMLESGSNQQGGDDTHWKSADVIANNRQINGSSEASATVVPSHLLSVNQHVPPTASDFRSSILQEDHLE